MPSVSRPDISKSELSELCRDLVGGAPIEVIFESGYSSAVFGVRLAGGDALVVKLRPWRDRLVACTAVQRHLADGGFPCPRPLIGPVARDGMAVSVEEYVPGGTRLLGDAAATPLAEVLANLVDRSPSAPAVGPLVPDYGFLRWRPAGDQLWPPATDVRLDLNRIDSPWIDEMARRVLRRLEEVDLPDVVGHGDWWSENIRWDSGVVVSVDDWDSAVALPEPAIVGAASALFADGEATVSQTAEFIESYRRITGRLSGADEREIAWAAGLWARLFDAKKALGMGIPSPARRLRKEAADRALYAGLPRD